jgi:hypothetical protein
LPRWAVPKIPVRSCAVLVVEDEPLVRLIAVELLRDAGLQVCEAAVVDDAFRLSAVDSPLGGQGDSIAGAINDFGWSVGDSDTATGSEAVLWSPSGKAADLGAVLGPAWSDTQAVGINDLGDIVEGATFGFLLKPDGVNSWCARVRPSCVPLRPSRPGALDLGNDAHGAGFRRLANRASKHPSSAQFTCRQCQKRSQLKERTMRYRSLVSS